MGGTIYSPPLIPLGVGSGFMDPLMGNWQNLESVSAERYTCGHCGAEVGPDKAYLKPATAGGPSANIFICPSCRRPTFIYESEDVQVPGPLVGRTISGITEPDVAALYSEARRCLASGAPSATVLVCRKLLMHLAVREGADQNKSFKHYAEYLAENSIVTKAMVGMVDHIKDQGNAENHELEVRSPEDAKTILKLVEFLLASIYELPGMVPQPELPIDESGDIDD